MVEFFKARGHRADYNHFYLGVDGTPTILISNAPFVISVMPEKFPNTELFEDFTDFLLCEGYEMPLKMDPMMTHFKQKRST
jgi:hypothetical protein